MRRLLIVLAALGLVASCGSPTVSSTTPSAQPQSPSASASASPTLPTGFVFGDAAGGSVAGSDVVAVRIGQYTGYDRIVIEFASGVPSYSVTRQANPTFTRSPRGDQVTLEGTAGVLIVVHSVTNWSSYGGPTAFNAGYPCLREALMVENFEGYQQWALGIQGTPALRVATLSSPSRLVVDVAAV